jgi:DNA invertase Pin-like site-specific DNA recombinase
MPINSDQLPPAAQPGVAPPPRYRAAQYVRMSTEHQQYSTENQAAKVKEYAEQRGIEIIRTYADEDRSGLRINGRMALQQLIKDATSGTADFSIILVYDVSRWGRFQDADESAYYEYIVKRAGIRVAYCAEQFENDGSPVSTIVKGVKRAMAGEYSRELSAKVFIGQCRLIELGYRQGGPAGYGLRRVLIGQSGDIKATLARGEHKSLQTDRVVLVPGPPEEVRIVNLMYQWFIEEGLTLSDIAGRLNGMEVRTDIEHRWFRSTVRQVLTNEKYIGNNVFNRQSFKLKKLQVVNPPEMWIRKDGAFEAVVPPEVFYTAQAIFQARATRYTDEDVLERLRALYRDRGTLSGVLIDEAPDLPTSTSVGDRFGGLLRAYELVGFTPERDYQHLQTNRQLRRLYPGILDRTERQIAEFGGTVRRDPVNDLLHLGEELTVSLVLARCQTLNSGTQRWRVGFDTGLAPDLVLAIRLDAANTAERDYYLLPRLNFGKTPLHLAENNSGELECFRFDTLEFFYALARRTDVRSGLRASRQFQPATPQEAPR